MSPGFARPGALPRSTTSSRRPRLGQRDRKEQPRIGHQAAVVEGDLDAVGMVKLASVGCSLLRVGLLSRKPLSPKHRSTFLPLQHTATLIFGGLGFNVKAFSKSASGTPCASAIEGRNALTRQDSLLTDVLLRITFALSNIATPPMECYPCRRMLSPLAFRWRQMKPRPTRGKRHRRSHDVR